MHLSKTVLPLFVIVFSLLLLTSFTAEAGNAVPMQLSDTCKSKRSRTFQLHFNLDTSTADYYNLLRFIESKGVFSRFGTDNKEDSSTAMGITLKRILCWEKLYLSPVESWKLNNVFSISYYLQSKPDSTTKEQQSFFLTQLNFKDSTQMETAARKIAEIRWGEPLLAFNFWFLIKGSTRIYIVQTSVPGCIAVAEKYRDIIRDEWAKQAN